MKQAPRKKLHFVRVAVAAPVKGTFVYAAPARLLPQQPVGYRVVVPFNRRKATGFVLEAGVDPPAGELKEILEFLDDEPLFHPPLVAFFEWLAEYYLHPVGKVIASALPGNLKLRTFKTAALTETGRRAREWMSPRSPETGWLDWIEANPGKRLPWPVDRILPFQKKGWLVLDEVARAPSLDPPRRRFVLPAWGMGLEAALALVAGGAKHEIEFLNAVFDSPGLLQSELAGRFSNGRYLIAKWVRKGVLEAREGAVVRDPVGRIIRPLPEPVNLYGQQENALAEIRGLLDRGGFAACLLHGVTGSGKTEVYFRAAAHVMSMGRQVILVVPEIALATYMEGLFRSRLGERVGVYHSGLTPAQRRQQWLRMARGELGMVIGARSALFAPFPRLGLLIVDEEHDPAYKQEGGLRYQGRDAAVMRARLERVVAVLGSGTPAVQSFQNTLDGRYHLISMPERVERRPLPQVEVVDMRRLADSRPGILSPRLMDLLSQNLRAGSQSILFLNRRGFHRVCLCRACGRTLRCPNCEVALVYHRSRDRLSCHYCGHQVAPMGKCPKCKGELLSFGFGTERLEQRLAELFPGAAVARLDADSAGQPGALFQTLKAFAEQRVHILVGTQLITKGYDFPGVTLVGVLAADLSLEFPDFRAGERTFQLLSQVAGRAGRGEQPGRVLIQTYNPDHYAVRAATAHDYAGFFQQEQELRKSLGYPPFGSLACLRIQGNHPQRTAEGAQEAGSLLRAALTRWPKRGREIQILGPAEAPLPKLKGKFRWQVLLKSRSSALLRHFLAQVDEALNKKLKSTGAGLIVDVDPYQMT